ncbi:MAG: hypothetical protein JO089_04735 [Alphaproteobacteria bacterium]|nr:hypothetical protein [Alphaproteobacteria bacterium]
MIRSVAVKANIPPAEIIIDAGNIQSVDRQWIGGAFGVHIAFNDGRFVVVPHEQAAILEKHDILPSAAHSSVWVNPL